MTEHIAALLAAVGDARRGLPEDVFRFVSRDHPARERRSPDSGRAGADAAHLARRRVLRTGVAHSGRHHPLQGDDGRSRARVCARGAGSRGRGGPRSRFTSSRGSAPTTLADITCRLLFRCRLVTPLDEVRCVRCRIRHPPASGGGMTAARRTCSKSSGTTRGSSDGARHASAARGRSPSAWRSRSPRCSFTTRCAASTGAKSARIASGASAPALAAVLAIATAALFLRACRWRVLLNAEGACRCRPSSGRRRPGYFGNNFLPARGGELVRPS